MHFSAYTFGVHLLWCKHTTFLNGPFPAFFLYFCLFNTVDSKCQFKFCQWLNSNCGPLESEATALPTEAQPLPEKITLIGSNQAAKSCCNFHRHRSGEKVFYSTEPEIWKRFNWLPCVPIHWKESTESINELNWSYLRLFLMAPTLHKLPSTEQLKVI